MVASVKRALYNFHERMETDRWRLCVVAYLLWVMLFAIVEGAGRKACRMPTSRWVAAGRDAREQTLRAWYSDRARDCLDRTRWYSYSMDALTGAAILAPFVAVWLLRRRVLDFGLRQPLFGIKFAALGYCLVFVVTLALMAYTAEGVLWLYDWMA